MSKRFIAEIECPRVPNFVRLCGQDQGIPVGLFTDAELRNLGRQWTANLIANAERQRKNKAEAKTE
jgi:hypothetical protein